MGATGWSYIVPYQQDIDKALLELKDKVFNEGQYEQPCKIDQNKVESQLDYLASVYQSLPDEIREHTDQFLKLARAAAKQQQPKPTPKSIKQLLEQCGTEGTHSILDIEKITSTPAFGELLHCLTRNSWIYSGQNNQRVTWWRNGPLELIRLMLNHYTSVGQVSILSYTRTPNPSRSTLRVAQVIENNKGFFAHKADRRFSVSNYHATRCGYRREPDRRLFIA
jgi:hypothetical protein